jgi:hypothetical protein
MVNGVLYSPKYNYIAYYCAKSGCSSLKHLFIDLHKEELSQDVQSQLISHTAKASFMLPNDFDTKSVPKFILVRNPYLRAVSMYINKYVGENSHIKRSMKEKNVVNEHGESFLSFLKFLKDLKERNLLNKIDGHMYEQSHEYNSKDNLIVIKLENFEKEIKKFYRKKFKDDTGFLSKIDGLFAENNKTYHTNTTKIHNDAEQTDVSKVEFTDKKSIIIPNYDVFYNDKTKKLVETIFHDDFVNFGYSSTFFTK